MFFKKCWYLFFLPIGLFLGAVLLNRKTEDSVKKEIKEVKTEIKEQKEEIQEQVEVVEATEQKVEEVKKQLDETISNNLDNKRVRDNKSKEFFPNL